MTASVEVGDLRAADGTSLRYRFWPAASPRAALVVVHGMGEHSGRYAELATHLTAGQISVLAPDLRGHGASGGRRGHVGSFDDYLSDLDRFFEAVAERTASNPLFLLGHSLGGLIALRYAQTRPDAPVAGLALSSPLLRLASPVPAWLHGVAGLLSRAAPGMALRNRIDPRDLTHDGDEVAAYIADPLVHDTITPRLYRETARAMTAARSDISRVRVGSVLFLVSGADRVVDPAAALEAAARLARVVKVDVRGYSGFYHEPFHETERRRPVDDLTRWLLQRIA